jgi:DMSO/TMAO reductase YedYZ molybdopterin-dependent catalytic subunit
MAYGSEITMKDQATLPPGQRLIDGFPRFGHVSGPPPAVPDNPVIEIRGAVTEPFDVSLTELWALPRREVTADFHCVAGWSAADVQWSGVAFETVYRTLIEPALSPGTTVTHLVCTGRDGWQSVVTIEDALADDVLIADRLDGRPLDGDHGAPARFLSPQQYGFINTKHLCRIDVHTVEPKGIHTSLAMRVLSPHPRARVWKEERHRHLPSWSLRCAYRATIPFLMPRGGKSK